MNVLRVEVTSAFFTPFEKRNEEAEGVLTYYRRSNDEK